MTPLTFGAPCLDSWSSWRVREWLETYPQAPLPAGILVTLLTAPTVYVNMEAFWSEALSVSPGHDVFDELTRLGRIKVFRYEEANEDCSALSYWMHYGLGSGPEMDDFFSVLHSDRNGYVFTLAPESPTNVLRVLSCCDAYYKLRDRDAVEEMRSRILGTPVDDSHAITAEPALVGNRAACAMVLALRAEAPVLFTARHQFLGYNEGYFSSAQEYGVVRNRGAQYFRDGGSVGFGQTNSSTPVFISPEEFLTAAAKGRDSCVAIASVLQQILDAELETHDEMNVLAKELWDDHIDFADLAGLRFDGIDVLSVGLGLVLPYAGALLGAGSALARRRAERKLKGRNGLVVFRDINRRARAVQQIKLPK